MRIYELSSYSESQFEEIKQLMSELTDDYEFTDMQLNNVLHDSNSHLYIMVNELNKSEGRIIGCASLCVFYSPTGTKASIEDVVISSAYRGKHLGLQLVKHVISESKQYAPIELHLTSNPMRVAANELYKKIGFRLKGTNCYRMTVNA